MPRCLQLASPANREVVFLVDHIFKDNGACLHFSACSAALRQLHRIVAPMETAVQPQREKQHVLCPRALPRVRSGSEYKIIQLCFQLVLSDLWLIHNAHANVALELLREHVSIRVGNILAKQVAAPTPRKPPGSRRRQDTMCAPKGMT